MGFCSSHFCRPARKTAVYRLYDRDQRLLYVGIAHDTRKRWREHALDKDWWGQVQWRTAIWHSSRLGAAIEEYIAIRYENPLYNKNRDYDYRLGSEPNSTPWLHGPRPQRLHLLAAAMKHPKGGSAWNDAEPHFAAVKCARQTELASGYVRIWFPQIPELGYWACGPMDDMRSKDELHALAANILTEDYGLDTGSFTLSLHDPDGCPEPELEEWVPPAAPLPEMVGFPWWRRRGARIDGVRVAAAVLEADIMLLLGISAAATYHLAQFTRSDGLLVIFGLGTVARTIARRLVRSLRSATKPSAQPEADHESPA